MNTRILPLAGIPRSKRANTAASAREGMDSPAAAVSRRRGEEGGRRSRHVERREREEGKSGLAQSNGTVDAPFEQVILASGRM